MSINLAKRILPLAGIVQSAHLVAGAAKNGMIAQDSLVNTLNCIFIQNAESTSDVYQGTRDIELGLGLLSTMLTEFKTRQHGEIVRYSLALIAMERAFARRDDISRLLSTGIQEIQVLKESQESEWIEALAGLYEDTLGQLHPRIQVTGSQLHLQNPVNIQRIRALLLAGLRSAVLWRQLGGRRWHLIMSKKQIRIALKDLK